MDYFSNKKFFTFRKMIFDNKSEHVPDIIESMPAGTVKAGGEKDLHFGSFLKDLSFYHNSGTHDVLKYFISKNALCLTYINTSDMGPPNYVMNNIIPLQSYFHTNFVDHSFGTSEFEYPTGDVQKWSYAAGPLVGRKEITELVLKVHQIAITAGDQAAGGLKSALSTLPAYNIQEWTQEWQLPWDFKKFINFAFCNLETQDPSYGGVGKKIVVPDKFYDIGFSISTPFSVGRITNELNVKAAMYAKAITNYNFHIPQYENALTELQNSGYVDYDVFSAEHVAPNLYLFLSNREYLDESNVFNDNFGYGTEGTPYQKLLTINGEMANEFLVDVMVDKKAINVAGPVAEGDKIKVKEKDVGDYFLAWSEIITKDLAAGYDSSILVPSGLEDTTPQAFGLGDVDDIWYKSLKNLCFLNADSAMFKDADLKKHLFPMHIDIEFQTDIVGGLADIISNTKLLYSLMNYFGTASSHQIPDTAHLKEQDIIGKYKQIQLTLGGPGTGPGSENIPHPEPVKDIESTGMKSWPFHSWVNLITEDKEGKDSSKKNVINDFVGTGFDKKLFPLGDRKELVNPLMLKGNNFYKALMLFKLRIAIKKYFSSRFRTYEQILAGKACHSETLFYKIIKKNSSGNVIQNIFIPNSSKVSVLKYVDTQVLYNKSYTYEIKAYVLVMGNVYRYNTDDAENTVIQELYEGPPHLLPRTADITGIVVENEPIIRLFEVPYITFDNMKVVDSPPVYPDVEIIPFRGKDRKLRFQLRSNTGRYFAKPIWFNEEEKTVIDGIRESQQIEGPLTDNTQIMFESDESIKQYEIYKIKPLSEDDSPYLPSYLKKHKPTSYSDFGLPYETLTNIDTFIDNSIIPNVKYYYMFRAIDNHGHFSNPSPIYEVEIVNNSGAIYPVIKIVEFEKPTFKERTKPFRRFLQIKPTFENEMITNLEKLKEESVDHKAGLSEGQKKYFKSSAKDHLFFSNGKWITKPWTSKPEIGNGKLFQSSTEESENEESIRKFKIRLVSKSTGKKLDLNVKFLLTGIPLKEDDSKEQD